MTYAEIKRHSMERAMSFPDWENLCKLTYAEAERQYWEGRLSYDRWQVYRFLWRNSAFRYSSIAEDWECRKE